VIALAATVIWLAGPGLLRQVAIVALGIDLGVAAYLYLEPVSPLMPGVAWLMMSLLALELSNRLRERDSTAALALGYAYLLAFVSTYALVIVQSPAYIGRLSARLMIELFALAVIAYWWVFRPSAELAEQRGWRLVHPYFVELLLMAAAVMVVVEIPSRWWAVAWAAIALILLSPLAGRILDQRAPFYSLIFYWVSVLDMAVVLSTIEVPSRQWHHRPEVISLIAIGLQITYAVIAQRRLVLTEISVPGQWAPLARLAGKIAAHRNLYVYYPLFAGITLFIYWRFDRSLLTLLWAGEAFVIFVLSAWLRESQFRYLALAGLAACLARLVLIDMAESNLAVRGVVFIGVGLLMLGMNAIYNRFHGRFEN